MNAPVPTHVLRPVDPAFVWEVVTRPEFDPDASDDEICRKWGYPVEVMRTREYMKIEHDLLKEYSRYTALAMLKINRDELFAKVRAEGTASMRESFHTMMMRLSGLEREEKNAAPGAGSGFVLNINIPGSTPVQVSSEPRPASLEVEDAVVLKPSELMTSTADINSEVLDDE